MGLGCFINLPGAAGGSWDWLLSKNLRGEAPRKTFVQQQLVGSGAEAPVRILGGW